MDFGKAFACLLSTTVLVFPSQPYLVLISLICGLIRTTVFLHLCSQAWALSLRFQASPDVLYEITQYPSPELVATSTCQAMSHLTDAIVTIVANNGALHCSMPVSFQPGFFTLSSRTGQRIDPSLTCHQPNLRVHSVFANLMAVQMRTA